MFALQVINYNSNIVRSQQFKQQQRFLFWLFRVSTLGKIKFHGMYGVKWAGPNLSWPLIFTYFWKFSRIHKFMRLETRLWSLDVQKCGVGGSTQCAGRLSALWSVEEMKYLRRNRWSTSIKLVWVSSQQHFLNLGWTLGIIMAHSCMRTSDVDHKRFWHMANRSWR